MRLRTAINQYISFRQSLGTCFRTNSERLNAFVRAVGPSVNLPDVKPESVSKYLIGKASTVTTTWHEKYYALRGFYRYVISRGYTEISPLPVVVPKRPQALIPYVYKIKELRVLFNAFFIYQKNKSNLDPFMARTLLILLYGAGLRIQEAISLTLADVDLNQACIIIRETKFRKTRLVPLGEQLMQILLKYVIHRQQNKYPSSPESLFFTGRNGKAIRRKSFEAAFRRICNKAGIHRTDGANYQPRLHDLRHTFAVHRITAWYKAGADVQRLLPVLSVYLGHAYLSATSTYLTMTPALLQEAGRRFEQYAYKETSHE